MSEMMSNLEHLLVLLRDNSKDCDIGIVSGLGSSAGMSWSVGFKGEINNPTLYFNLKRKHYQSYLTVNVNKISKSNKELNWTAPLPAYNQIRQKC